MKEVLSKLADSHCHLEVDCNEEKAEQLVKYLNENEDLDRRSHFFHMMTTNWNDLLLLDKILEKLSNRSVVGYVGIHPWFSHLFGEVREKPNEETKREHYCKVLVPEPSQEFLEALPMPVDINECMEKMGSLVDKYAQRGFHMGIGEIGLDKLFRLPVSGFCGNQRYEHEGGERLSQMRVSVEHQLDIFIRQLHFAEQMQKQVSIHCVKAHGLLYDVVRESATANIPAFILHSYSGSVEQAQLWVRTFARSHQKLFFSLSNWINGADKKQEGFAALLNLLGDTQILVETDVGIDRYLLDPHRRKEYYSQLYEIFKKVCRVKRWKEENGQAQIFLNWTNSLSC